MGLRETEESGRGGRSPWLTEGSHKDMRETGGDSFGPKQDEVQLL